MLACAASKPELFMEVAAMLVFTRKMGEAIVIGEDISVTVVRVGPNDVRIGIEAPQDTPIERDGVAAGKTKRPTRAARTATHSTK
jgi:carbon storage regulator